MKKIPTIFQRDWDGDRSRVLNIQNKDADWVFSGEGWATRKIDGTCCLVRDGKLFRRRELKKGQEVPPGFEQAGFDQETQKTVGWMPVTEDAGDAWHRLAFSSGNHADGTYELVGPKIQGNPEHYPDHRLIAHSSLRLEEEPPRNFEGLREWMSGKDIEGIVWHHADGRMAKIKMRDFGLKRAVKKG